MVNNNGNGSGLPARPKMGTGFTNLQRFVNANKNNQLGAAVTGGISQGAQKLNQNLGQAQTSFNQKLNENNLDTEANRAKVQNVLGAAKTGTGPSDEDAKFFDTAKAGTFNGPNQLENVNGLRSQAGTVQNIAQSASSDQGRRGLLQRFAGGPQYTAGQQRLDSLVLGKTVNNNDLAKARIQAIQAAGQTQQAIQNAGEQAKTIQGINKNFATNTQNQLNSTVDSLKGELDTTYNTAKAAQEAEYNDFITRLKGKNLTVDDVSRIQGVLGGQGRDINMFGLTENDLAQAFKMGALDRSRAASSQQLAATNALARLAGKPATDLGIALDENLVGKKEAAIQADGTQFSSYKDKNEAYRNALNPVREAAANYGVQAEMQESLADQLQQRIAAIDRNKYLGMIDSETGQQSYDRIGAGRDIIAQIDAIKAANPTLSSTHLDKLRQQYVNALQNNFVQNYDGGEGGWTAYIDPFNLSQNLRGQFASQYRSQESAEKQRMDALAAEYGAAGGGSILDYINDKQSRAQFTTMNPDEYELARKRFNWTIPGAPKAGGTGGSVK